MYGQIIKKHKYKPFHGPDVSSPQSQGGALLALSNVTAAARLIYSGSLCSVVPTMGLRGVGSSEGETRARGGRRIVPSSTRYNPSRGNPKSPL